MMSSSGKCRICGQSAEDVAPFGTSSLIKHASEILKLVNSNDAPDENATTKVQSALADTSQELDLVSTRIASILSELPHLLKQRTQKDRKIEDYRRILHPIRKVPAEVLSQIFLNFVPDDGDESLSRDVEKSSIDQSETSWILSHVSSRWRAVALSSPQLWSAVHLGSSDFFAGKAPFILGTQLQRSGNRPLSVSICSSYEILPGHPLFQVLIPTSYRWATLRLRITIESYKALSPWLSSFPLLTTLSLYPTLSDNINVGTISHSGLTKMFQFCPILLDLTMDPMFIPLMHLPFLQIRQFDASGVLSTSSQCLVALKMLPNLQVFHMLCDDDSEGYLNNSESSLPIVSLFHLEQLSVHTKGSGPVHLLDFIKAPALKILAIANLQMINHLLPFIQKSEFSLTFLKIQSEVLIDFDFIPLLEWTDSLKSLSLHCPLVYTTTFIERLAGTDKSMLVPCLESLELEGTSEPQTKREMGTVLALLQSVRPDLAIGALVLY